MLEITYRKQIDNLRNLFGTVQGEIQKGLWILLNLGRNIAVSRAPRGATNALVNSIQTDVDGFTGKLGTGIIYGIPVEYGTRPHHPPVAPLAQWARRKLRVSPAEATPVAWAIAKTIERRGTKAQPFMKPAAQVMEAEADDVFGNVARNIELKAGK